MTDEIRDPGEAWVRLPDAVGPIKAVLESSADGLRRQRIILTGAESLPGENALSVLIGRSGLPEGAEIDREIAEALPDTPMRIASAVDGNAAGPFRYAIGEAGPFTCVYAWQSLDGASLRIRLCRTAPAEDTLALIRALAVDLPETPAG